MQHTKRLDFPHERSKLDKHLDTYVSVKGLIKIVKLQFYYKFFVTVNANSLCFTPRPCTRTGERSLGNTLRKGFIKYIKQNYRP